MKLLLQVGQEDKLADEKDSLMKSDLSKEKKDSIATDEQIDILMAQTEALLKTKEKDGIHSTIERDDKYVIVNLWKDRLTEAAVYVKEGQRPKSQWNDVIDGMTILSNAIYSNYKPYGINVMVNLLNNRNHLITKRRKRNDTM